VLSNWLVYIILGRLLIWAWQEFPLPNSLEENKVINKLHNCDFCSGVWIYSLFSYLMQLELLEPLGFNYVHVASELITGIVISFLIHIFIIGWKARFEVVVI
jgi:inner membrane protein involved in colicin E2 resistance